MKRGGAEGWGRGRRVRCSIGHYLRRVTGSVVTAPRFAHWLPVLHRSPTSLSLFPSLSRLSISFLPRSLCLSPLRLVFFVYSPRPHPAARLSAVSPLRKRSARFSRRPQEVRPWIGSAARKTSAFFPPVSQRERLRFARLVFFSRGIQRWPLFSNNGVDRQQLEGSCF